MVSFGLNTTLCDCEKSKFCDPHHKHIIASDLRIRQIKKLRKDPNYKKPGSINFRKAYFKINQELESCIEKMFSKNKLETSKTAPWRKSVLIMVKEKN